LGKGQKKVHPGLSFEFCWVHRMTGHVDPTKKAFAAFCERSVRPDPYVQSSTLPRPGRPRESHPVFSRLGGRIVWRGRFELMLIGPVEEKWDECFIAEYPSVGAFVAMASPSRRRVRLWTWLRYPQLGAKVHALALC
jgi:hypothetical protein